MKDSGVKWIGEIPEDWEVENGKRVLELLQKPVQETDEVITCFRDGEVVLRSLRRTEGFTMSDKEIGYQHIDEGDIVIHGMDGFAGSMGISKSTGKGSPVLIVCKPYKDNANYLMYYLRILAHTNVFLSLSTGIRERSCDLKWNKISVLPLLLPPLAEQTRISNYLDSKCTEIDELVKLEERMITELQKYKQSVITETVTRGLNKTAKLKDSGVEWIGMIPEEWGVCRLKNVVTFHNGDRSQNYPSPDDFKDEGIPFLGADSLDNQYVDLSKARFITEMKYQLMGGLKIQHDDILYTLRGSTIGKNAIANFDNGTVASSLMGIRIVKKTMINAFYLYAILNSTIEYYQRDKCINGSTAPNLSADDVKDFYILLPPLREQERISSYLDKKTEEIDGLIKLKESKIQGLKDYKKSLIYEYVTGKKRV